MHLLLVASCISLLTEDGWEVPNIFLVTEPGRCHSGPSELLQKGVADSDLEPFGVRNVCLEVTIVR